MIGNTTKSVNSSAEFTLNSSAKNYFKDTKNINFLQAKSISEMIVSAMTDNKKEESKYKLSQIVKSNKSTITSLLITKVMNYGRC